MLPAILVRIASPGAQLLGASLAKASETVQAMTGVLAHCEFIAQA